MRRLTLLLALALAACAADPGPPAPEPLPDPVGPYCHVGVYDFLMPGCKTGNVCYTSEGQGICHE